RAIIISACAYALLLIWGVFNVHPGASLPKPTPAPAAPVVTQAPVATPVVDEQQGGETEGEVAVTEPEVPAEPEKPHYTIAEGSVLVPKANPDNFGSVPVANASELSAVIQQARDSGLLGAEEKMVFDPSLEFNTGSYYQDIKYYYDETILAIAWKQIVDGNTVTCMEVKVADASQFRRKITGDTYGSPSDYLSNLNKSTNAVVSMNADFYQFRDYGTMVYDGTLYKCTDKRYLVHNGIDYKWYNCLDNCYITRDGDMLFTYFGEEFSWDEMQQYVTDNNVSFSLSFGPILVDNYEVQDHYVGWYPVGEVDQGYSRAGFGQVDKCHYLYMSLNHSDEKSARWTMYEFGQFFQSRGVEKAYAFDGGQTSEIIFNGEIYNHIDKSSERWVSDMVYFGTALPEEVWNNG
ncbi:MAG: phosphodiester glycosidase family protein, partial [Oscillospiraceae bacterium]|nr:phosphodiester glycosidase family protein [Oscillospiraceae bacterium]